MITMSTYQELNDSIITGKNDMAADLTRRFLDEGKPAEQILNQGLLPGMAVVGKKFQDGEYFIPEMLMAARALNAALDILKPLLEESGAKPLAKILLGTVAGDIHDIGKNLVGIMLKGGGFEVIDAGVDNSPEKFVALVKEHQPEIIGLSALLTTTMPAMQDTIKALQENGIREKIKVMIGGAPITQDYADKIGADGYAKSAAEAVGLVKDMMGAAA
jgi:5-methyltetrahydrofolate--homocysteine methyltransferase